MKIGWKKNQTLHFFCTNLEACILFTGDKNDSPFEYTDQERKKKKKLLFFFVIPLVRTSLRHVLSF